MHSFAKKANNGKRSLPNTPGLCIIIQSICHTGTVWGLENDESFAISTSGEYTYEDGAPMDMICFWSDKDLAISCAVEDWKDYYPVEITLSDFIENWCIGMANDEFLAGLDFDKNMTGYEANPLRLIIDMDLELKKTGLELSFQKYESMDEMVAEVKDLLERE